MERRGSVPSMTPFDNRSRLMRLATETARRFDRHHLQTHAAALAYRGALALFPFLILVFAVVQATGLEVIVRAVTVRAAAGDATERGALALWINSQIDDTPNRTLVSIGVLTALWAVATGIRALRLALAVIGEQPLDQATPPVWRRIVLSLGIAPIVVVVTIAAALSLLLTARGIDTLSAWLGRSFAAAEAFTWLRVPAALVVITLFLAGAYLLAPRRRHASGLWGHLRQLCRRHHAPRVPVSVRGHPAGRRRVQRGGGDAP